jgi:hypothetical protein
MRHDNTIADRITGLVFLALGISMLVGGFFMDRLEFRQIHPASIPGLLPMGLGAAMAFCALLLVLSTGRQSPLTGGDNDASVQNATSDDPGSYKNLLVTAFLSIAYAAGLVGQIPFYAATAIFIFLFSVYFLWPGNDANSKAKFRISLLCAVYAMVFAVGISVLFRYGFLVRLP